MDKIIEVKHIKKSFVLPDGSNVNAVNDISFDVEVGSTFGLVGESGSGKTTVGKCILGLYSDVEGNILYKNSNLLEQYRNKTSQRDIQVVFQDPYASLNPTMTIEEIILEPIQKLSLSSKQRTELAINLLNRVELDKKFLIRYPHELSGGQRQRIGIARALSTNPDLIILDEPISSLDVIIQAKIVRLLKKLQQQMGVTYIFIAHDLEMVRYMSDRIGVMYQGKIVEYGNCETIYNNPQHIYTQHLLDSILEPNPFNKNMNNKRQLSRNHMDFQRLSLNTASWSKVEEDHYVLK